MFAIYDPLSVANNKFGIHILEPSEIAKAAELVNSTGGDWGYVTIPIRANDRDIDKWTTFMKDCRRLHIIPILRIASFGSGDHWMAPNEWDLIDFANFLNDLPWPIKNRYIVVYNEPNHASEWGDFIYPQEYARVLDRAIDIFHKKNADFFIISAGMDSSSISEGNSENEYQYFSDMETADPGIFTKIDGLSTHSYGNPNFTSFPNIWSRTNIANYRFEENYLTNFGLKNPLIFITEAGWRNDLIGDDSARNLYTQAFQDIWVDDNLVAITPFLLSAPSGSFSGFSFTDSNNNFKSFAQTIKSLPKNAGKPQLAATNNNLQNPGNLLTSPMTSQNNSLDNIGLLFSHLLNFLGIHKSL